jgi:hypothetical protein
MSFREGHNYTHSWGDRIKRIEKNKPFEVNTPPPLEVKNPKVLENVQRELNYILGLKSVKKSQDIADSISIYLKKGEESKRSILSTSPNINIEFTRDNDGNITEKKMFFQRGVKKCEFIFSNGENGEVMSTGENNLDSHYNEAIYGWVQAGMKLFKDAIEQDAYTPNTSVNIEYARDTSTTTEQPTEVSPKGPMEI